MARPVVVTYRVSPNTDALATDTAEYFTVAVAAAVAARGLARVAISGGTTPKGMFALLADRSQPYFARMPWDKLHLFWVDERCVPPADADSNYRMTNEALLSKVPLPAAQIHRMEGELDPELAASRYGAKLRAEFKLEGAELPAFDLVVMGMGDDGHTASLFPHTAALHESTRLVVANHVPQMNTWRITLTQPVINHGRDVVFEIQGKPQVIYDVFLGPYDPESKPSQLIRPESGALTLLLDAAAASKLPAPAASDSAGKLELT